MSDAYLTDYGFVMGAAEVTRLATMPDGTACIRIAGKSSHVDVYVSPAGRSVRVFGKSNGEWKPLNLSASCIPGDHT